MENFKVIIADSLVDTLKLVPFLYITYLVLEFIEHKGGKRAESIISASGRLGPLMGSVLGIVPQCGFSAAAAGFYAGRIITTGTLLAVFLSTSDEMLPILISGGEYKKALPLILSKFAVGIAVGFLTDIILSSRRKKPEESVENHIHCMCEDDHCHCESNLFLSALRHCLKITVFLLIASLLINAAVFFIGEDNISSFLGSLPLFGEAVAALMGLIPNCAPSVIITNLYIKGVIGIGPTLSGLLSASGLGILVLFRTNKNLKENIAITVALYLISVSVGFAVGLIF